MKKKKTIALLAIVIIGFGIFMYHSYVTEAKNDSIVTDKNGEIVEPLKEDENNFGH